MTHIHSHRDTRTHSSVCVLLALCNGLPGEECNNLQLIITGVLYLFIFIETKILSLAPRPRPAFFQQCMREKWEGMVSEVL